MNILFLHRGFPGQFKYLSLVLANDPNNNVMFITNTEAGQLNGINKLVYKTPPRKSNNPNQCLSFYEETIIHGKETANLALAMKNKGITPDIIYGFAGWGSTMFMKDIFPDVPLICYLEWYGQPENSILDFGGQVPSFEQKFKTRCDNSHLLVSLYSCDGGIAPTHWQKQQFPKEFHNKIQVIHDGIDTDTCKPDSNATLFIEDKNIELSVKDEVITYGTKGMEPYRGFPEFMQAAEKILKKRPNAHIVIAGANESYYSPKLTKGTYKELMLQKLDLDMSRVHFVGILSFLDYIKFLQISSVHVYSTFPYVLSWSILNAMSTGCCVIGSNTAPVQEVIKDNYNGLLFDFFNVEQLAEKIEYALDNQDKMQEIRQNARQTVLDNYDIRKVLPQQINFLKSFLSNKPY